MGQIQNTFNAAVVGALGATKVKDIAKGVGSISKDIDNSSHSQTVGDLVKQQGSNTQWTTSDPAEQMVISVARNMSKELQEKLGVPINDEVESLTATKDLVNVKRNMKALQKVSYNSKLRAAKNARMQKEGMKNGL